MSAAERKFWVGQRVEWIEEEVGGNPESGPQVFQTRMEGEYVGVVIKGGRQFVLVDVGHCGGDGHVEIALADILPHRPDCFALFLDDMTDIVGRVSKALERDGQEGRALEFRARAKDVTVRRALVVLCEEYVELM